MKLHTYLLSLFVIIAGLFPSALVAAGGNAAETVVEAAPPPDDLANFVLEKAKLYSEKGEAAMSVAVDVMVREAPAVVTEFLVWGWWKNIWVLPAVLLPIPLLIRFGIGRISVSRAIEKEAGERYHNDGEVPQYILGAVSFVTSAILTIAVCAEGIPAALTCVQIAVAPRIYLLEHAAALLR